MITAPMEMIPTAGVRMIEIMIVTGTMTAAMDLTVIEIMDMMNASELLHAPITSVFYLLIKIRACCLLYALSTGPSCSRHTYYKM